MVSACNLNLSGIGKRSLFEGDEGFLAFGPLQ
jgi:hypothetical protein